MKKRIVGIIMVLIMCSTYVVMPEKAQAATLSDEMAEWFVNSFYTPGSKLATAVQKTLTGKMEPEESVVKSIYSKIAKYVGYADKFSPSTGDMAMLIHDTNELCKNVSAAINIVDNYKSMLESDLTIQKTVDALQVIKGFADLWGYGSYFPTGMGLALSTIESSIKVGGVLEQSYLQENLTMYEYELMIDYYAGNELTFRSAPTLALGTSITQEQADAMYAACYLKYYFMQQTDDIVKDDSDIWSYTFISCCPEIANVTYYTEDIDTICDLIENGLNRQGYIFKGWYTDRSYTTPIYYDENFTSSGTAHKCYAKWQKRYYTINYNSNCNDVSNYSYQYDTVNNNWQGNFTMSRDGYVFGGWYWDSACTNKVSGTFDIYDNITFYAKWQKRYYTITYDSNCQEVENYYHQFDITLNNWLNNFEMKRPGYMFMGWYTDSECTTPLGNNFTVERDLHLYAKWIRQYDYTVSNGKATLTKFNGFRNVNGVDETDIIIPDTIDGYPIAKIGNRLFENKVITSVTISDNVTEIDGYAFAFCPNLTSVAIPNSVTSIGEGAFNYCSNLKDVYITDIAAWLLCKKDLFTFTTPYNLYINKELATNITIPYNVTSIEEHALEYCQSITSITIPSSMTSIGFRAFYKCSNLKDIYITDFMAWLLCKKDSQFTEQPYNLYINKELVTSITIPNSVTSISANAFNHCQSLASVTIPTSVTNIGDFAFSQCCNLSSITIPEGITSIGRGAFIGCISLTDITMPDSVTDVGITLFYSCRSLKNIKLSKKLTKIDRMFSECDSLTSVTIPANITSIRDREFDRCSNLKNITVDGNNQVYSSVDGVLYNKEQTELLGFPKGKGGDFIIPNGVTSIGDSLFSRCENLTSVTIPDSVKNISRYAFYDCKNLTNITFSGSVTSIGEYAFYNCDGLKNVYFSRTPEEWNNIQISSNNTLLTSATIYYAPSLLKIADGSLRVTAFPGKYNVILASYDSDGSLYDIKASECQFPNNGSTIMTIENPDSIVDVSTDGYVNAMFWDSLDSMIPLCEPEMILCNE